jgi:hypothetical protein
MGVRIMIQLEFLGIIVTQMPLHLQIILQGQKRMPQALPEFIMEDKTELLDG